MIADTKTAVLCLISTNVIASIFFERDVGLQTFLISFILFIATGRRYRWLYILRKTWRRDLIALKRFTLLKLQLLIMQWMDITVPKQFSKIAQKYPNKIAFCFENKKWTYSEVDKYSNKVSNFFKKQGYKRGDSVAVMMNSRPEIVFMWLGLAKLGIVAALINSNLVKKPLIHSISTANSSALVFGYEVSEAVSEILTELGGIPLYQINGDSKAELVSSAHNLDAHMKTSSDLSVPDVTRGRNSDRLIYIYTSGTTGLPKAAVITHARYMVQAVGIHTMLNISTDDIIYDPLPLYHTAGGILGVGQALLFGSTVAIRSKFSASNYWSDCIKYNCTVSQYIGEMCRYLLSTPEKPEDRQHKVRLVYGNGLRPQIWKKFRERFGIQEVGEFYGATEGNSNLINIDSTEGAVGFIPPYLDFLHPVKLIRVNEETGEPLRGKNGCCILCKPGEPGIAVGKIDQRKAINSYSGYVDKKSTQKTILKNVFSKGDQGFNSGDMLVMDEFGYFYFKDRTGDTFRWRGENVATSEVEGVISSAIGLKDVVVYGVEIPNVEGRAGMAAILDENDSVDLLAFAEAVEKNLPFFARPLFVRIAKNLPLTGTYKLKKREMQIEGFNPKIIKDKLYFLQNGVYIPLTQELFDNIIHGKERL